MRALAGTSLLTLFVGSALLLVACGSSEKQVSFDSAGMTHTMAEGESVKKNDFPLPVYPNAQPTGSVSAKGTDEHSSFMMLSSSDSLSKVSEFYSEKLKEDGWTVNATTSMPNMVNISASKKDLEGNVMVGLDSDKTTITLAVSKEPATIPDVTGQTYTPDKINPPTD